MYKVHTHACAIRKLMYGWAHVREIIHSRKLVDYLSVNMHKPYTTITYNYAIDKPLCMRHRLYTHGRVSSITFKLACAFREDSKSVSASARFDQSLIRFTSEKQRFRIDFDKR